MHLAILFKLILHYVLDINEKHITILNCWEQMGELLLLQEFLYKFKLNKFLCYFCGNVWLENVRLHKEFNNKSISSTFIDIGQRINYVGAKIPHGSAIFLDYDCPHGDKVLLALSERHLLTRDHKWLIVTSSGTWKIDEWKGLRIPMDAHVQVAKLGEIPKGSTENRITLPLYHVYRNSPCQKDLSATINRYFVVTNTPKRFFFTRSQIALNAKHYNLNRFNLSGCTLKTIQLKDASLPEAVMFPPLDNKVTANTYSHFALKLMVVLQEIMDFR